MALQRFVNPVPQFVNTSGSPFANGSLTFYQSGTDILKDTYSDSGMSTPNTNPIVLNSYGSANVNIWMNGTYRIVAQNSTGSVIWDVDPVSGNGGGGGTSSGTVSIVNTLADLRAITTSQPTYVEMLGYNSVNDGGGGSFYWDATSTDTDNGGSVIQPTGIVTGRFIREIIDGTLQAAAFGIVADSTLDTAGTDNADQIQALIAYLASNPGLTVVWPQDLSVAVGFTGYLIFSHCIDVTHIFGSPLLNIGSWNAGGATVVFGGSIFINHLAGSNPEISRQYPNFIGTTAVGDSTVTLLTPAEASNFAEGDWVLVCGYDQQGNGFPPNYRYNEYRKVISSSTMSGDVVLDMPLVHFYDEDWYSYLTSGNPVGPAGIMPLSRGTSYQFANRIEIHNLVVLTNPDETPAGTIDGDSYYRSSTVQLNGASYIRAVNLRCSQLFTGECDTCILENPAIVYYEGDKEQVRQVINGGVFTELNQCTGIDYIDCDKVNFKYQSNPLSKSFNAKNCYFSGTTDRPIGFNQSRYQLQHVYEDNTFAYGQQRSIFSGNTPTEDVTNPDQPGNLSVTVAATPTSSTFKVTFGVGPNAGIFRINAGIGTILVRPSDLAQFVVENITFDGTDLICTYSSAYQVAISDILYFYTQRALRLSGNRRLGEFGRIPWLSEKRISDVYINEDDAFTDKTVEFVIRDFPPAAATNNLYEIDGIVKEIEIVVETAYSGGGDNRIQISAWTPFGSTFPTQTIRSNTVGQRFVTAAAVVNNNGGAAPAGETLTAFGYNRYLGVVNVRPLAADNPGATGWSGYIKIRATRR